MANPTPLRRPSLEARVKRRPEMGTGSMAHQMAISTRSKPTVTPSPISRRALG